MDDFSCGESENKPPSQAYLTGGETGVHHPSRIPVTTRMRFRWLSESLSTNLHLPGLHFGEGTPQKFDE